MENLSTAPKKSSLIFPGLAVAIFFLVEYVFNHRIERLGEYASYIFEVAFIFASLLYYRMRFKLRFSLSWSYFVQWPLAFVGGIAIYKLAGVLKLPIPFDLTNHELILFLLLIGPIIEECLFRLSLWWMAQDFISDRRVVIVLTALIFAFAHFDAYFLVPKPIKMFVLYQTVYTFAIGLWWGVVRSKSKSVGATIPLHMLFNFGFYCGFLLLR